MCRFCHNIQHGGEAQDTLAQTLNTQLDKSNKVYLANRKILCCLSESVLKVVCVGERLVLAALGLVTRSHLNATLWQ
jgi:hypothetical protein